jgi:hypothetical protein
MTELNEQEYDEMVGMLEDLIVDMMHTHQMPRKEAKQLISEAVELFL